LPQSWFVAVLFLFALCTSTSSASAADASWVEVGENVELSVSNPIRSRRSPDAQVNIQLTNNSAEMLEPPYRLVFEELTDGVAITGSVDTSDGTPSLDLEPWLGEGLAPGAISSVISVNVVNGGQTTFSFQPSLQIQQVAEEAPLTVDITSPKSLITIGYSPLQVQGTISQEAAILTINGKEIPHSGGQFSAEVALEEGYNTIVASARDGSGVQASATLSVSLDLTPPYVTVESHDDGQIVRQDSVTVTGLINDVVRGTIEDTQASVTVNGKAAEISNRSYSVSDVSLTEGENLITVKGADQVGNVSEETILLIYEPNYGNRLTISSGNNQHGPIGEYLNEPLKVRMIDQDGLPIEGQSVVFRILQGAGALENDAGEDVRALVVDTDNDGMAEVKFGVGYRVGVANHKVRAQAVGERSEVIFTASAEGKPGDKLSVNSGNNQRGAVGQTLPAPFVVVVTDSGANVVKGASVEFRVLEGGGTFSDGTTTKAVLTDSDGRATVQYRLGEQEGLDAQKIQATIKGPDGSPISAGFMASAFQPGDPGETSITGVVLDNQDTPIPGVTVRVDDTNRQSQSDSEGRFEITEVPVGPVHLVADGSTATVQGEFPSLAYNIVTVAGVENPLAAPIYMVKVDTENAVYAGPKDVELTLEKFPGFKLEIAKGSITFPDGEREGYVSATAVNASKIPMAPPNGMQPQFIVTIQPTGAKFDPPARLSLPNVDGHRSGAQVEMYSFDHDLEEFVAIGLGTVSEDGSVIRSNKGVGVIKAGWHCGSQPGGSGCCYNCSECQKESNCNCVNDPAKADKPLSNQTPGDCQTALCQGSRDDNSDVPTNDKEGDCRAPACIDGTPDEIADETDITPEDAECKFCDGKELKPDPGKEDLACGDGSTEQNCYTCKDGDCGNHCDADKGKTTLKPWPGVDAFADGAEAIENSLNRVSPYVVATINALEANGSVENGEMCCSDCSKGPDPKEYYKYSGTVSGGLEVQAVVPGTGIAKKLDEKLIAGFIKVSGKVVFGLGGEATADFSAGGNWTESACDEDEECVEVSTAVSGTVGVGVLAEVEGDVLSCSFFNENDCTEIVALGAEAKSLINVGFNANAKEFYGPSCSKPGELTGSLGKIAYNGTIGFDISVGGTIEHTYEANVEYVFVEGMSL
jgi:hypothetical protein